jgi:uncharacterized membrane protein
LAYDWRSRTFIALSVMGVADAIYHAYGEITYSLGSCSISNVFSCSAVFGSGFTRVLGVQFWVYGVVWFPVTLAVGLWAIRRYGSPYRSVLVPYLMVGNIFTLYPWDIEIRLLGGRYCLVCISLYLINYILTVVALTSAADRSELPALEEPEPAPAA